jgi:conjugative transfer pilus assembly protein TraH
MQSIFSKPLFIIATVTWFSLLPSLGHAGGFGLKNTFENLHINNTNPGKYQDAAAGWYSGGSSVIRTRNTNIQPFAVTAPTLRTGCSGIDAFAGSFSMISGQELVNIAKNIGSQAVVYGFHLGMKTYAPQIEQVLKDLRNLQMELNQFGIGHCKATQAAFAAALPQNTAMYETVCSEMAAGSGYDLGGQRQKCRDYNAQKDEVRKAQEQDPQLLMDDYNLFVKVATELGISQELRESLMSMVGTIIVKDGVMIPYPALAEDEHSWSVHIKGGTGAAQYRCDNPECLNIRLIKDVEIPYEESYAGKAKFKLDQIKQKIATQSDELSDDEKGFLDSLGEAFPIFDHITLEAASGITILDSSSEVVAGYMLLTHLKSITSDIQKSVTTLKQKQQVEKYLTEYQKTLSKLLKHADIKWLKVIADSDRINERAEKIEKHLIARERG